MRKHFLMGILMGALLAAMLPSVAVAKDAGKVDCKKGGWAELVRADGTPFADQGECVTYVANGGTPRPPERILAISYSDLDGTDGYLAGTADVLIAKFVDTDGNGPDVGDRIEMGRYPTNFEATGFAAFQTTTHTVRTVYGSSSTSIVVDSTTAGALHTFFDSSTVEGYEETRTYVARIQDWNFDASESRDTILAGLGAPSSPATLVSLEKTAVDGDSTFIDTDVIWTP